MNCQEFEILMADALGDELSPADRPAFEAHLAQCARCREEYESAGRAVETMRTLPGPRRVNVRREGDRLVIEEPRSAGLGERGTSRRSRFAFSRFRGVFRYAASVLIAFTAGYAVHAGLMVTDAGRQTLVQVPLTPEENTAQKPTTPGRDFRSAIVSAATGKPSRSDLAKCLVAMAGVQR